MLKLTAFEFFIRLIPEGLILIFASYAFSRINIDIKRYILSTIALVVCVFIIRLLPINYGVHTFLNIIMLTIIVVKINKIEIIKAVKSSIIITILLFLSEALNVFILRLVVGDELDKIVSNTILRTSYFLPSLIFLALIISIYYKYLKKGKKLSYV